VPATCRDSPGDHNAASYGHVIFRELFQINRSTDQLINFTVAFTVNLADYLIPLPRFSRPYLKMHQIAFRPSFQPIFLPSSCDLPT
jgi:hypothetical protein